MVRHMVRAPFPAHPRGEVVLEEREELTLRLSDWKNPAAIEKFVRYPALNSFISYNWHGYLKKNHGQYLVTLPPGERGSAMETEHRLRAGEERERLFRVIEALIAHGSKSSAIALWNQLTVDSSLQSFLLPNLRARMAPGDVFEISIDSHNAIMWSTPFVEPHALDWNDRNENAIETPMSAQLARVNGSGSEFSTFTICFRYRDDSRNPERTLTLYQPSSFQPSYQSRQQGRRLTDEARRRFEALGQDPSSCPYQGTLGEAFLINRQISEDQNCAVYITDIPPSATPKDIFNPIWEGGIQRFSLQPVSENFRNQAATVVFKTPVPARNFQARSDRYGVYICGRRISTIMNRDKVKPLPAGELHQSRVLVVTMPVNYSVDLLVRDIRMSGIVFELVETREGIPRYGRKKVTLVFGSIIGQSRQAVRAFIPMTQDRTSVYYGCRITFEKDPCDPNSGDDWNGHMQA